ncbi:hypothetical protein O3M35_008688 [Rhynocoris fuscipes]|uniref:Uncharacterized protein n=1 Tax=Rhynocoris fuscipes TaxID=488301 RepID=A0AAW1D755_9HEMI
MNDYKYHYLFTTFDIESFNMEDFKYNFVNMTAFRIVDLEDLSVKEILKDMERFQTHGSSSAPNNRTRSIEVSHIFLFIYLFR